ncbi:hypothetical protein ES703_126019 [subsurface metagenome]
MFHILKVCIKHWRCCCKPCANFEPATPTKEAIARLDCRFQRKVYFSTKEIKFLVKRAKIYDRPPGILPYDSERGIETSLMDIDTAGKH